MPARKRGSPSKARKASTAESAARSSLRGAAQPPAKRHVTQAGPDAQRPRGSRQPPLAARRIGPPLIDISRIVGGIVESPAVVLPRVALRRPDDLLVGTISWQHMELRTDGVPRLERISAATAPMLLLELPPQSFGEEAFLDATGPEVNADAELFPESSPNVNPKPARKNVPSTEPQSVPAAPGVKIRMSGPSRLVVRMPDGVSSIPYTQDAILDAFRAWPLVRMAIAAPEPPNFRLDEIPAVITPAFLREITTSSEATTMAMALRQAVPAAALRTFQAHLARASAEVSDMALQALQATGDGAAGAAAVANTIRTTVDQIAARIPELNQPALRALTMAAVSANSIGALLARPLDEAQLRDAVARLPQVNLFLRPTKPWTFVTALELPYRLFTSPIDDVQWRHASAPVTANGRTELWHTRLSRVTGPPTPRGRDVPAKIRAVWSDDYALSLADQIAFTDGHKPFRMPLDTLDRAMLVKLMAGFDEDRVDGAAYRPRAAVASRLTLSALGALLEVEGSWSSRPVNVDLQQWRHLASLGRDHYVKVVYAGFLFPFGHAASLIKVTERKFESSPLQEPPGRNRIAVLRQRFFIAVREVVKTYDGRAHARFGHCFPFTSVELVTRETPSLIDPTNAACRVTPASLAAEIIGAGVSRRMLFWPLLDTSPARDFKFDIAAIDRAGDRVTFSMPLLFVGETANQNIAPVDVPAKIRGAYNNEPAARRMAQTGGVSVCFAPVAAGALGDPRLPTRNLTFRAGDPRSSRVDRVNVYPEMEEADCGIRAIQRVLGRQNATVRVKYSGAYTKGGFDAANPGEVFLELLNPFSLSFGGANKTDALGALASPSMDIAGLSRLMGPAADIAKITGAVGVAPAFDPVAFFKDARILGGIKLADLLTTVTGISGGDVPKFLSRDLPDRVDGRFDWETRITKSDPLKLFQPDAGGQQTRLLMHAVMTAPISNPTASTFKADATLNDFKVDLFGCLILWFTKLQFTAASGQKPDVVCDMHPTDAVVFGGPLEFVNELKDLIPSDGFTDPPTLNVTPTGISAGFSLTLPSVQVGVFALSNMSLRAAFALPFDAQPVEVKFNFCTRERPFTLTVAFLGGGGFFLIGLGTDGVREIEAALEFGAGIAINLGVAAGAVEIRAGVYFHWLKGTPTGGTVELSGYVRLHGELTVLGIFSASLTFNLQLGYRKQGHESYAFGEATLTVEISLFIFSVSVSVRCYREFGGSASDPTVLDLLPEASLWDEYCLAYAAE